MRRLVILAGTAVLAGAALGAFGPSPALAQPPHPGPALATPDFITAAAQTDAFEREEGRLAESRAASPRVKAFGRMMVKDHTMTTAGLKRAIRRDHMAVPPPPPLTDDQTGKIATLKTMHGPEFDRTYLMQQIEAHRMALGVMQGYAAAGGGDRPIRDAAAKTVPIVEHHLMMAEALRDRH